jgi:hypothetical protein
MAPEVPKIECADRVLKEVETMRLIFNILSILNNVGCVLTSALFILYYRSAYKKNLWEEVSEDKGRFRKHSIIMLWWISGTIMISVFNLNILLIVPLLILGAFSATFWSVAPNSLDRNSGPSPSLQPQLHSSSQSRGLERELLLQDFSPNQSTLLPDLGKHLAHKAAPKNTMTIYPSFTINEIAVVGLGKYCITKVQEIDGELYCGTFDFGNKELDFILAQASERAREVVVGSLVKDAQSVRHIQIPHPINVGIKAVLGKPQQGVDEAFIPLVITEVFSPR